MPLSTVRPAGDVDRKGYDQQAVLAQNPGSQRSFEDDPRVARLCTKLIWTIVLLPIVLAFFCLLQRLGVGS